MTSHIINVILLAGAAFLCILTGSIALYAKLSSRRDRERCNFPGGLYHEPLETSPGSTHDLYQKFLNLERRLQVLEDDYYRRLDERNRARRELLQRYPAPKPGAVRKGS